MLIAIMGDTFDAVMETKLEKSTFEKCSMLGNFRYILKKFKINYKSDYVLILQPTTEISTDDQNWISKVKAIKNAIKRA